MSTSGDPDATMPVQGGGYPGSSDPTVAGPGIGQGGGATGGGGPGGGEWDGEEEEGDRRRLWMIAGGVLALGVLVGALIAVLAGGGDDDKSKATTTSSSTSTSTSTSTTTPTPTSTTPTTQPAGVQILSFSVTPNPVTCPSPGATVNVLVKWATQNTQSVTVGIDGPGPFHPAYSAQTGQDTLIFSCSTSPTTQHKYFLTAYAGPNMTGVSKQQVITLNGNLTPATTTTTT